MSEQELINRCLRKDKKAWSRFVDKYSRLVYWAIHRRLNISKFEYDQADIEDIFQEVFLTILKGDRLQQVNQVKKLSGWVAMVASSRAFDFMRKKIRRREDFNLDSLGLETEAIDEQPILVQEIIDNLPERERRIISLNLLEARTHAEIAEILNLPINTVSTIIARTKEKLRKIIERK